ncbi:radical SAM protein [Archaeoglobus neptunius]|uniref:radical SAM protein n=1 Tax=Archaeoglobus neptunius TaxID=2798580 RepID=UPI001929260B|nr:radical SAM protein [Archaeoglobus neptunius]
MGLERYEAINRGEAVAKFQIAKRIEAEWAENLEDMLQIHKKLKQEFKKLLDSDVSILNEDPPGYSFLHLKKDILYRMLEECNFCERRCGINRFEKKGFCKCGVTSYYSSEFLHVGEEPELIPSHTIFFNRCTFACVFCQNYDIVYDDDYIVYPRELALAIDVRYKHGSRNVNFVGGNPDQHAHTIAEILLHVSSNIPVVWNSNMYHSTELAEIIEDFVDVWLGDFKYGNSRCALKYSRVSRYWEIVTRNFLRARENGELLIRHLVMPSHIECCTEPIVSWVAENLGQHTRFNLMFQYYPTFKAWDYPEIARRLSAEEMEKASRIAENRLKNLV